MRWLIHHGKRVIRITGGIVVLLVGIVLAIPGVPGPGFVFIFLGLSILAVDFVWAHRLKTKIQDQAGKVVRKIRGQPAKKELPVEKV
jgi:tellurite resistance protein TerC